jgi:pimeloyl-ACP methyl ester carboxylesterase
MSKTILFIHGAWLTPAVWEPWQRHFEAHGYRTLAPAWPLLDRPVTDLRESPDADLGKLTLGRIADHYAAIIATLPEPPILIGHSYGGLIAQQLLDRGLGAAAVSISPAPAAGIRPGPKAFRAALPVFLAWRGWSRALTMKPDAFARDFVNGLDAQEQRAAYDRHVAPAPGRLYYQSVLGIGAGVQWNKPDRAPLLLITAENDRIVEPGMVKQQFSRYLASPATTELRSFGGRGHWLIADRGWKEVADVALEWVASQSVKGAMG